MERRVPGSREGDVAWFRPLSSGAARGCVRHVGPRNYGVSAQRPCTSRIGTDLSHDSGTFALGAVVMVLAVSLLVAAVAGVFTLPAHMRAAALETDDVGRVSDAVSAYAGPVEVADDGTLSAWRPYQVILDNVSFVGDSCQVRMHITGHPRDALDIDVSILDVSGETLTVTGTNWLSHELMWHVDASSGVASLLVGVPCSADKRADAASISVHIRGYVRYGYDEDASRTMLDDARAVAGGVL